MFALKSANWYATPYRVPTFSVAPTSSSAGSAKIPAPPTPFLELPDAPPSVKPVSARRNHRHKHRNHRLLNTPPVVVEVAPVRLNRLARHKLKIQCLKKERENVDLLFGRRVTSWKRSLRRKYPLYLTTQRTSYKRACRASMSRGILAQKNKSPLKRLRPSKTKLPRRPPPPKRRAIRVSLRDRIVAVRESNRVALAALLPLPVPPPAYVEDPASFAFREARALERRRASNLANHKAALQARKVPFDFSWEVRYNGRIEYKTPIGWFSQDTYESLAASHV